jgi:LysM repeat protein
MHEYMLVNKSQNYTAKPPTMVELTPLEYANSNETAVHQEESPVHGYEDYYEKEEHVEGRFSMGGPLTGGSNREPEEVIRRHTAAKNKRRGNFTEQKRAMNLLAGLCAVLFVVTFVMGVGLVRNQDRVDNLEGQLRQMAMAIRDQEITAVFAEGDVPLPEPPGVMEVNAPAAFEPDENATAGITEIIYEQVLAPAPTPEPVQAPSPVFTPAPIQTPQTADTNVLSPAAEQAALVAPIPETYTIQPGDSLLAISLYFFGDANMVNEILAMNGLDNPDHIIAGRTIALPPRR